MGLFAAIAGVASKAIGGVRSLIKNARVGKQAIQAGFVIKAGSETDQSKAANSIFKSIPLYVWGLAVAVVVMLGYLVFGRHR